jgi:hypothetical protein
VAKPKKSAPVRRRSRAAAGLHYFRIQASPAPGSANSRFTGAYISCWVNYPHGEGALVLAKHYIRGFGWRVRYVQEHRYPKRSDYARNPALKYFDEAAADGSSFVFHTYTKPKRRSNKRVKRTREK